VAADTCKKVPGKLCCGSGSGLDLDLIGVRPTGSRKVNLAFKKFEEVKKKFHVLKSLSLELGSHSRRSKKTF